MVCDEKLLNCFIFIYAIQKTSFEFWIFKNFMVTCPDIFTVIYVPYLLIRWNHWRNKVLLLIFCIIKQWTVTAILFRLVNGAYHFTPPQLTCNPFGWTSVRLSLLFPIVKYLFFIMPIFAFFSIVFEGSITQTYLLLVGTFFIHWILVLWFGDFQFFKSFTIFF